MGKLNSTEGKKKNFGRRRLSHPITDKQLTEINFDNISIIYLFSRCYDAALAVIS